VGPCSGPLQCLAFCTTQKMRCSRSVWGSQCQAWLSNNHPLRRRDLPRVTRGLLHLRGRQQATTNLCRWGEDLEIGKGSWTTTPVVSKLSGLVE
jgi:hypothetical protein